MNCNITTKFYEVVTSKLLQYRNIFQYTCRPSCQRRRTSCCAARFKACIGY